MSLRKVVFGVLAAWAGPASAYAASDESERAELLFERLEVRERFIENQAEASRAQARAVALDLLRQVRRDPRSLALPAEERATRERVLRHGVLTLRRHLDEHAALDAEVRQTRAERRALAVAAPLRAQARGPAPRFAMPVVGSIVGGYGRAKEPATGVDVRRTAIQVLARGGETVRAPAGGVVKRVARGLWGAFDVLIEHEGGYLSVVSGMREVTVVPGQRVPSRAALGSVGRTFDGAPIVSWGLWRDRAPVDPRAAAGLPSD